MTKSCKNCNNEFKTNASELRKGKGKFCSHKCSAIVNLKSFSDNRKGTKSTEEHKMKIGLANRGKKNFRKGVFKSIKYRAIHQWINTILGKPSICKHCGKSNLVGKQIHWANISHTYLRKAEDWIRLCASCHKMYDQTKSTY